MPGEEGDTAGEALCVELTPPERDKETVTEADGVTRGEAEFEGCAAGVLLVEGVTEPVGLRSPVAEFEKIAVTVRQGDELMAPDRLSVCVTETEGEPEMDREATDVREGVYVSVEVGVGLPGAEGDRVE